MTADQYSTGPGVFSSPRHRGEPYSRLVAHLVPPGERLLGVVDVDLSDLIRRVPRKYRPKESDGLFAVVFHLLGFVGWVVEVIEETVFGFSRVVRRIFRGRGLVGGWQSQAGRFAIAVLSGPKNHSNFENHDVQLVFTDRRILLTYEFREQSELLGEIPRDQLRRAEIRHTSMSDRVDLHFADGSCAALGASEHSAPALEALAR
ncbi:hypothetical protein KCMC57_up22050 [Kitasatospora sp. CMC57]|uniref:Uncharacterized protein n=1 Tax=Kitasatospora sp. CMC57 TaxID=3231513 RepID=A0AB33JUZ2_9ACTN